MNKSGGCCVASRACASGLSVVGFCKKGHALSVNDSGMIMQGTLNDDEMKGEIDFLRIYI